MEKKQKTNKLAEALKKNLRKRKIFQKKVKKNNKITCLCYLIIGLLRMPRKTQ